MKLACVGTSSVGVGLSMRINPVPELESLVSQDGQSGMDREIESWRRIISLS